MREDRTREYWDRTWTYDEKDRPEHVFLDGSDGEDEFDEELLRKTVGKTVLDEGCGAGSFTRLIARKAKHVTGIDSSTVALRQAQRRLARRKTRNVEFRFGDVNRLPFPANSFDVVYSRRGPGSDSLRTLTEVFRVLKRNGVFMEITIGERDKQSIVRIFGRGQMLGARGQVSDIKKRMMERVGFRKVVARDYLGTEVFEGMRDLLVRLRSAPIIPGFNLRRDRKYLRRVREECVSDRGIETQVHRVVLIGRKSR
ncbi:MAG TPA: methyltransferase domain-containing protein [Candidatus Bathyarchaeia archaeon]|nr:methyltransferase domain-containing protein [Candidatus Bathyarchaeia archaeon]